MKKQYFQKIDDLTEDIVFFNEPFLFPMQVYQETVNRVIEDVKRQKEVTDIFQVGNISAPSISDVDLLIVINENYREGLRYLDIRRLNARDKYVFPHQFFIVPRDLLQNLFYFLPIFNIKSLYSKLLQKNQFYREGKTLDLIMLNDLIIYLWPHEFLSPLLQKRVDVRTLLCRLGCLKYTLTMYQNITGKQNKEMEDFVTEIRWLQSNWFNLAAKKRLKILIEKMWEAVFLLLDLSQRLTNFLEKQISVEKDFTPSVKGINFILNNRIIYFGNGLSVEQRLAKMVEVWKKKNIIISILPEIFIFTLLHYQKANNSFGNYIKANLNFKENPTFSLPNHYEDVLTKRITLLNSHMEFLAQNRLAYGYFMNFGYIPSFNLKYQIRTHYKFLQKSFFSLRYSKILD